jgi:5-methylthioadenosine/S-adenosylhomocysteine deaminase
MATINAAKAIGLDDEIGSLEPGKLADIAIFNLDTPHSSPATNPIASLVFSARGPDAHTVFVNGREVVRDHRLTTLGDMQSVLARARARAQEIVTKAGLSDRAKSAWLKPSGSATERTMMS